MTRQGIDRRQLLRGACCSALFLSVIRAAEAASPLRVIAKLPKSIVKAWGKAVSVSVKLVIRAAGFAWDGTVGTFQAVIGQTKSFVKYVAGLTARLTIKATMGYVWVRAKVTGAFGTLTDTVTVNI